MEKFKKYSGDVKKTKSEKIIPILNSSDQINGFASAFTNANAMYTSKVQIISPKKTNPNALNVFIFRFV